MEEESTFITCSIGGNIIKRLKHIKEYTKNNGAYIEKLIMKIPKRLSYRGVKYKKTWRVSQEAYDKLKKVASDSDMTRSEIMERYLVKALEENNIHLND